MIRLKIEEIAKSSPEQLLPLLLRVEGGEEIEITRDGKAIARLVPYRETPTMAEPRIGGQWDGKVWIAPDFDEWPVGVAEALGMKDS